MEPSWRQLAPPNGVEIDKKKSWYPRAALGRSWEGLVAVSGRPWGGLGAVWGGLGAVLGWFWACLGWIWGGLWVVLGQFACSLVWGLFLYAKKVPEAAKGSEERQREASIEKNKQRGTKRTTEQQFKTF